MPDKTLVCVEWNEQTTFKRTSYEVHQASHRWVRIPLFEAKDLDLIIVPGLPFMVRKGTVLDSVEATMIEPYRR